MISRLGLAEKVMIALHKLSETASRLFGRKGGTRSSHTYRQAKARIFISNFAQDERAEGDAALPIPPAPLRHVARRGRPHRPPVRPHAPSHRTHRVPLQVGMNDIGPHSEAARRCRLAVSFDCLNLTFPIPP